MRNILTIAGKETRVYFTTWTSYILLGAFTLITAFFFQRLVIEYQLRSVQFMQYQAPQMAERMNLTEWIMGPLFMNMTVFFLFMLPILTMRLIAEERRSKTLELMMTAPIRPIDIVLGKYLASILMMSAMLVVTLVFPLLLTKYGASSSDGPALDWRSVLSGYGGLFLMGSAFVAIGLFASSISDSQIVAVIVGFSVLLMFYVIGLAARGEDSVWQKIFEYVSCTTHLETFVRGVVRLQDIVYYLSMSFLGLFLTYRVVEAQRWK